MGTQAEVLVVDGDPQVAAEAQAHLDALEERWSRFRPHSDISVLNRAQGRPVVVSPETLVLVDRALTAARATGGRFDPTVGAALLAHGYDRSFAQVAEHAIRVAPEPVVDGSWPGIEIDHEASTVVLPAGTVFDPGGIGKGLAADLVSNALAHRSAGLLVNVGGDLRMRGQAPTADGWIVAIDDPFDAGRELARLSVPDGAVATSSRMKRRWETASGPAHHLIDPRTGRPAATGVAAVTVVAAEAWWAEVQATSVLLLGPEGPAETDGSVEVLAVLDDGSLVFTNGLEAVLT